MQKNTKIELSQTHEAKPETMNRPMRSISIDTYRKSKEYDSTNDRPFLGSYIIYNAGEIRYKETTVPMNHSPTNKYSGK